jgi:hypothetical protein
MTVLWYVHFLLRGMIGGTYITRLKKNACFGYLKNLAIYYLFQINSYCFWVFFPCHSCTELYVNIHLPSNLYPLKWTILLQFHPPYNFYAVNPGQITLFFSIMLKVQPKFTKFHIYCSSYPFFVITQLVHTL